MEKSSKVIFIVAVVALVVALGAIAIAGVALAAGGHDGWGRGRDDNRQCKMRDNIGPRAEDGLPQLQERGLGMGLGLGLDLQRAAQALGMTEADLQTELSNGKTLAQIAQERGVATQTLVDALLNQAKADLAQRVADGKITQAQADQMLTDLTERIQTLINSGQPGRSGGRSGPPGVKGTEQQAS